MDIFMTKWFSRWVKKDKIDKDILRQAAEEVAEGIVEANLGGFLFKKRVVQKGKGKRGGYRVIIGYKNLNSKRLIFIYSFNKSRKDNISSKEEAVFSIMAKTVLSASDKEIEKLLKEKTIEVL